MKLTVTRKYIENASRKDSHHCMIADAIKEEIGAHYISVDTQSIRFSDPHTRERYIFLTPPRAQNEILRWDRGLAVQPFSFQLTEPIKVSPLRTRRGKKSVERKAQRRYAAKRRVDPMAPRLVKKKRASKSKVSRFREFGVRKWTKEASPE